MTEGGGFMILPLPPKPQDLDEVLIAEVVPDPSDPLEVMRVTVVRKSEDSDEMECIIRTNLPAEVAVMRLVELAQDIIQGRIIW